MSTRPPLRFEQLSRAKLSCSAKKGSPSGAFCVEQLCVDISAAVGLILTKVSSVASCARARFDESVAKAEEALARFIEGRGATIDVYARCFNSGSRRTKTRPSRRAGRVSSLHRVRPVHQSPPVRIRDSTRAERIATASSTDISGRPNAKLSSESWAIRFLRPRHSRRKTSSILTADARIMEAIA